MQEYNSVCKCALGRWRQTLQALLIYLRMGCKLAKPLLQSSNTTMQKCKKSKPLLQLEKFQVSYKYVKNSSQGPQPTPKGDDFLRDVLQQALSK